MIEQGLDNYRIELAYIVNRFHTRTREPDRAEEARADMQRILDLFPSRPNRDRACTQCGEWVRRTLGVPELPPEHPGNYERRICIECGHQELRAIEP